MKTTLVLFIGIIIGVAIMATTNIFAEKPLYQLEVNKEYEKGFIDGRVDGYHAATEQLAH